MYRYVYYLVPAVVHVYVRIRTYMTYVYVRTYVVYY